MLILIFKNEIVDLSKNKISEYDDYVIFKNTFVQVSQRFSHLSIQDMYWVLETIKSCSLLYITRFVNSYYRPDVIPPEEIFKRLFQYHNTKIEEIGTDLVYDNVIVSLK